MCQDAIIKGVLFHDNIAPLLGIYESEKRDFVFLYQQGENGTLSQWRQRSNPSLPESLERVSLSAT